MKDVYCPIPWMFQAVRNNGDVRICCQANVTKNQGVVRKEDGSSYNAGKDNMDEARNAKLMKIVRKNMLEGKWSTECGRCKKEEDAGLRSRRQYEQEWGFKLEDAIRITEQDGTIKTNDTPLVYYDLRFGNLCNLKCRMCGPGSSTEWAKEIYNNIDGEYSELNKMSDGTEVYYFDNDTSRLYDKNLTFDNQYKNIPLKNIRRASFLGGEPLLQNETFEIMSYWAENNNTDVRINITTNGTNFTKQWIDLFKKFTNIKIVLSSDGVDDTFDYIRTNANWSKVKQNVTELAELRNIEFVYSYTIQMYNSFNLVDILDFLRKWNIDHTYLTDFDEHYAERVQQTYLSTALLDNKDRNSIMSDLGNYVAKYPEMARLGYEMMDVLQADKIRTVTEAERKYFIDYTNKLDKVRKTNLVDLDPRFKKYLI